MTSKLRVGALAGWSGALLATVSLTACASGSEIAVATTAGAPTIAAVKPDDPRRASGGGYLIASGNVLLQWRDPARAGTALASQVGGPGSGLNMDTPAATLAAQTTLAPGGVVASTAVGAPALGVQAGAGLTAAAGVTGNLVATGQPLTALGVGGLLSPAGPATLVAGPTTTSIANPNTVAGALLTDLTGAAMQLSGTPAGPMAPATVPSVQNLGAVLSLLKPPGL